MGVRPQHGAARINSAVESMRRKQYLHDLSLELFSGTAGARPLRKRDFPRAFRRRDPSCQRVSHLPVSVFYLVVYSFSALP